jgi:DNA transformation protein
MRVSIGFRDFVLDQLSALDGLRARAMFGGVGLYSGETFFGILAADVLYFKVDDRNRADYVTAGMPPFRPYADRPMTMSYYALPLEVLEDSRLLVRWAKRAIDVAATPKDRSRKHHRATAARPARSRRQRR